MAKILVILQLRIVGLRAAFTLLGAVAFTTPASETAWDVKPDPNNDLVIGGPASPTGAVPLRSTHLVFPSYSSRFVALDPKVPGLRMDGDWFQVYELRYLQSVGPAFPAPVDLGETHILNSDGTYLAGRAKGQRSLINIWDCKTGKIARSIQVSDDPDWFAFPADFVGRGRLLTKSHDTLFPVAEHSTLYQVWDLDSGKEIVRFNTGLVWSCKWATISPGGRYLVMEKTERHSYRLLAWDLTTGRTAGEAEWQGKNEPWGQICGVVFSPDAKELAIVWRLGKPDFWGKVFVFDVVAGKTIASFPLDYTMKNVGLALNIKDHPPLQWTPSGRAWLILGHLLVDRGTGAVIGSIGREPHNSWEVEPRRFVGPEFLTAVADGGHGRELTFAGVARGN